MCEQEQKYKTPCTSFWLFSSSGAYKIEIKLEHWTPHCTLRNQKLVCVFQVSRVISPFLVSSFRILLIRARGWGASVLREQGNFLVQHVTAWTMVFALSELSFVRANRHLGQGYVSTINSKQKKTPRPGWSHQRTTVWIFFFFFFFLNKNKGVRPFLQLQELYLCFLRGWPLLCGTSLQNKIKLKFVKNWEAQLQLTCIWKGTQHSEVRLL